MLWLYSVSRRETYGLVFGGTGSPLSSPLPVQEKLPESLLVSDGGSAGLPDIAQRGLQFDCRSEAVGSLRGDGLQNGVHQLGSEIGQA